MDYQREDQWAIEEWKTSNPGYAASLVGFNTVNEHVFDNQAAAHSLAKHLRHALASSPTHEGDIEHDDPPVVRVIMVEIPDVEPGGEWGLESDFDDEVWEWIDENGHDPEFMGDLEGRLWVFEDSAPGRKLMEEFMVLIARFQDRRGHEQ